MKITIDIDAAGDARMEALSTPSVPIPPPELLKRAKALGALNAGPPNMGSRASATDLTLATEETKPAPRKRAAKRPARRAPR